MTAAGDREGDGAHAIVPAHATTGQGTRYVVSLGRDEQAQLAVAGSLTLAAPRFQPLAATQAPQLGQFHPDGTVTWPDPETPDSLAGLPATADAYAALGWDTSLRGQIQFEGNPPSRGDHASEAWADRVGDKRATFVIPAGHEAVHDTEGRATGETRPIAKPEENGNG